MANKAKNGKEGAFAHRSEHGAGAFNATLYCGDWREHLAHVDEVDCVITDPPYSARTHAGHEADRTDGSTLRRLGYTSFGIEDVHEVVSHWAPRVRYWCAFLCDDELTLAYKAAMHLAGLQTFAPVPVIYPQSVRLVGDGPASAAVYMMAGRRRSREAARCGSLPGYYLATREHGERVGGKTVELMRTILCDYTRPGWTICDPFAGHGTTLLAAASLGVDSIGAEVDEAAFDRATVRLGGPIQQIMHPRRERPASPTQGGLL